MNIFYDDFKATWSWFRKFCHLLNDTDLLASLEKLHPLVNECDLTCVYNMDETRVFFN